MTGTTIVAIPPLTLDPGLDHQLVWVPHALCALPTGAVQGGAVFGAAITAMEQATGRPARWASCQFLAAPSAGRPVQFDVSELAVGRSSTQARCTARVDGEPVLLATAALGARDTAVDGTWAAAPSVPEPAACEPLRYFERGRSDIGDLVDLRVARRTTSWEPGRVVLWARVHDSSTVDLTTWELAIVADFAPMVLRDVLDAPYIGSSVDNTIRVGRPAPSAWVLLDVHVDQVAEGFAHLRAHMWSHDADTLLATVAQTATLRRATRAR